MADSAGDKAHLDVVTAHTLHALYLMQKREKGCETFSFWFKFQREVCMCVCVSVCLCLCVYECTRDMFGIESKIFVLYL